MTGQNDDASPAISFGDLNIYNHKETSNVVIIHGEKRIHSQLAVLSKHSAYFASMESFAEKAGQTMTECDLSDQNVSCESIVALIFWCHTGMIAIPSNSHSLLLDLLFVSEYLQMEDCFFERVLDLFKVFANALDNPMSITDMLVSKFKKMLITERSIAGFAAVGKTVGKTSFGSQNVVRCSYCQSPVTVNNAAKKIAVICYSNHMAGHLKSTSVSS